MRAVLGPAAADTRTEETILRRGEGNPFFLEELGRAVAGRGEGADPSQMPDTLHGVLMARLDALGRERGFPDGPAVVTAARAGDASALEAIHILGERLGVGIANAINTFDPEQVVIGGGVSAAGELLLEPARAVARRFVLPGVGTRTEIRLARFGPKAGVRGAALLAGQEVLNS